MQCAPIPSTEKERIKALQGYKILDTLPEIEYDRITKLASIICSVPISLVSLVDSDRQWFKSKEGLDAPQTARDIAFCSHAILEPSKIFVVNNALEDKRFSDNPLVTDKNGPQIRFYAGMPLNVGSNKHPIGTLCIIDTVPRELKEEEMESLRILSDQVVSHIELRNDFNQSVDNERRTKEEANRMNAVMNTVLDGLVTVDEEGLIQSFNPSASRIFGYNSDEVIGENVNMLLPENYHSDYQGYLNDYVIKDNNEYTGLAKEISGKRKDNTIFPMEVGFNEMQYKDKSMLVGTIRDISSRKEAERLKSEFVSVVSHELRTPLTSIRGSLGLVLSAFSKDLSHKVGELLNIAHSNCERLIFLINDILDIDKIASGQMRFDMKEESLSSIMKQAVAENNAYCQKYKVDVNLQDIDESIFINVDSARYIQVLSNLISNAAKFSNEGDKIDVGIKKKGQKVHVFVKDYGIGIPEEFRERIFSKFSQADSSSVRDKGGTGLGLYISKQMIENMKGDIGFETQSGKGTTFWVDFDMINKEVSQMQNTEQANGTNDLSLEMPEILHVEDDMDFSNLLATSLQDKAKIINVPTVARAVEILGQRDFSAVIVDIGLPDGSGLDVLRNISNLASPTPPVMILSASEMTKEIEKMVSKVIVKSRLSEDQVVQAILYLLKEKDIKSITQIEPELRQA